MKKNVDSLTIKTDGKGDNVPLASLAELLVNTLASLRDLDPRNTLLWRVADAKKNSPLLLTTTADATVDTWEKDVVDLFMMSIRVAEGIAPPNDRIPVKVLRRSQKLVRLLSNGIGSLEIHSPGRPPLVVSPELRPIRIAEVTTASPRWDYEDFSEIEGTLEVASTRNIFSCEVCDSLTGKRTRCLVSRELLNAALDIMKIPEPRVAVYGLARYDSKGYPIEIVAEAIELLPNYGDDLDALEDSRFNITDGTDSVDYIRSLRDDD